MQRFSAEYYLFLDENTKLSEKISSLSEDLNKRIQQAELLHQETEADLNIQVDMSIFRTVYMSYVLTVFYQSTELLRWEFLKEKKNKVEK